MSSGPNPSGTREPPLLLRGAEAVAEVCDAEHPELGVTFVHATKNGTPGGHFGDAVRRMVRAEAKDGGDMRVRKLVVVVAGQHDGGGCDAGQ